LRGTLPELGGAYVSVNLLARDSSFLQEDQEIKRSEGKPDTPEFPGKKPPENSDVHSSKQIRATSIWSCFAGGTTSEFSRSENSGVQGWPSLPPIF
jgi:hypothetical protein